MDAKEVKDRSEAARFLALRMTGDPHLAEDFSQAAFLKCLEHQEGKTLPVAYITAVVRNDIRTTRRTACTRRRRMEPLPMGFDPPSHEPDPSRGIEEKELSSLVRLTFEELPAGCRETAYLRWIDGQTVEEIAAFRKVSRSTVYREIDKAKEYLKRSPLRDFMP